MEDAERQQTATEHRKLFKGRIFGGDASLWIIIAALAIISVLVIYSSTAPLAYSRSQQTSFYMLNQLRFLLLGFGVMFVVHRFDYQSYSRYTRPLFFAALGLMVLTFFVGVTANEATRSLRFAGLTFQPADFLKITLVMVLAKELAKRQGDINRQELLPVAPLFARLTEKRRERNRWVMRNMTMPLLLPIALACGMIFISNFSTSALLFVTCLVMFYLGRVRGREIWRLLRKVILSVAFVVAVMYAFGLGRSEVWVNRVTSFAGIEKAEMTPDELAVRERNAHQVENAKMAIASGGIVGRGPGQSVQRTNLPLPFSDYAYAFIVEEYGLVGAMLVLVLYLWLFYRTIVIFRRCEKSFPSLLVLGLGTLITLQAFVSMLVAVDLFPVTGLPLPYISLGGSSLLFTSIAIGMILGVSRQMQEKTIGDS
ncbi:MAG: FtsW/RodA/SpoVE family cell cycle protein [Rikenellaceae bacterium]|nr:FtsW/RodA/SpoVE family cell cycle protein [Rikenellaceae bacterium]MCL2693217.1 FtsW/RodA/SpoVE family cell cycle protein [Rikenellaceae bacterium]